MFLQIYTHGQYCDSCSLTAFAKSNSHIDGCLACICMGVTSVCTQSFSQAQQIIPQLFRTQNGLPLAQLSLYTATNAPAVGVQIVQNGINGLIMAECIIPAGNTWYWSAPTLNGNLLMYYESLITFEVDWITSDTTGIPVVPTVLLFGLGSKMFTFQVMNSTVPQSVVTTMKVILSLENIVSYTTLNITRAMLLKALTNVQAVLLPATYYSKQHTSRLDLKKR